MRAQEGQIFSNISANTAAFKLTGGRYLACATATFGGGSIKLQKLGPDGTTYVSVAAATDFSAAGCGIAEVPPGDYRFTIATATAVYISLDRVPGE